MTFFDIIFPNLCKVSPNCDPCAKFLCMKKHMYRKVHNDKNLLNQKINTFIVSKFDIFTNFYILAFIYL
jgi:hypothetical protein